MTWENWGGSNPSQEMRGGTPREPWSQGSNKTKRKYVCMYENTIYIMQKHFIMKIEFM